MKKRIFTMLFAIIMVIAISVPYVSAANAALTTSEKVGFTVECSKPGYEFSVYKIADLEFRHFKGNNHSKPAKSCDLQVSVH